MSPSTLEALRALQTAPETAPPVVARRPTRAVFIGLAVAGLLAAAAITFSFARDAALATLERRAMIELDALVAASARVGAALRTFGAPREPESAWFSRTSALVAEANERARSADATLVGIAMMPRARVAEALQSASEAVERAHANSEADRDLMAQDVIESNGKPAAEALDSALMVLRTAAADEVAAMRSQWRLVSSLVLAAWALVWGIGLAWFARVPDTSDAAVDRPRAAAAEVAPAVATPAPTAEPAGLVPVARPQHAVRDAGAVANACEVVAGLTDATQMASALEGMAQALGASGLVLWMRDGDALAAAAVHGYPPDVPQRLGRVAADDPNLIARAWQARTSQTAPEGPGQRAAVAAPIGAAGVVTGVLAAEFPAGREADADVVATSRILAAQLSAVLGEGPNNNGNSPHLEATGS